MDEAIGKRQRFLKLGKYIVKQFFVFKIHHRNIHLYGHITFINANLGWKKGG